MTSRPAGSRPRSGQKPRTPMAEVPLDDILLTEDADMATLEAQLLDNTALNYSRDEAAALCTTLNVLGKGSMPPPLRFNIRTLTLLPPERSSFNDGPAEPSEKVLEFLTQLSISARDAASGLITSSLIAGRRSEAEDHGDVAFWVGAADETRLAESLLESLHIILPSDIYLIENRGDQLLTSLNMINPVELNAATRTLHGVVQLLQKLDNLVEYRTLISEEDALVLYICAGTFEGEWCGLLGVSVESD